MIDRWINRRATTERIIETFRTVWGDRFDYTLVDYSPETKVCIICKDHGKFFLHPWQHNKGVGCYQCGRLATAQKTGTALRLTTSNFIARSSVVHDGFYDYRFTTYQGALKCVEILCPKHGLFKQRAHEHMNGARCTRCVAEDKSVAYRIDNSEWIRRAVGVHGDLYDYAEAEYQGNDVLIRIGCRSHGHFSQIAANHLQGAGCRRCAAERMAESHTKSTSTFIREALAVHDGSYDYSLVEYHHCNSKVRIICSRHGEFKQTPNSHLQGSGCPRCRYRISKPAAEWLQSLALSDLVMEWRIPETGTYADGYDPVSKTVYLFHGDYWHGNPNIYETDDFNKRAKMTYGELYTRTILAEQAIRTAGYALIVMWEQNYSPIHTRRSPAAMGE